MRSLKFKTWVNWSLKTIQEKSVNGEPIKNCKLIYPQNWWTELGRWREERREGGEGKPWWEKVQSRKKVGKTPISSGKSVQSTKEKEIGREKREMRKRVRMVQRLVTVRSGQVKSTSGSSVSTVLVKSSHVIHLGIGVILRKCLKTHGEVNPC